MDRHITDRTRSTGSARLQHFIRQEHIDKLHPAIRALHSKPREDARQVNSRLAEYLRIARGIRI